MHKHIPSLATIKWQCEPFLDSRIYGWWWWRYCFFHFHSIVASVAEPPPSTSISIQFEKPNHRRLHHHFVGYVGHSLSIFLLFFPFCFFFLSFLSVRFPYMHYQTHDGQTNTKALSGGVRVAYKFIAARTTKEIFFVDSIQKRWLQTVRRVYTMK